MTPGPSRPPSVPIELSMDRRWSIITWREVGLIVGVVILTFPPLAMGMPEMEGLDFSWMLALREASKRGLVFGRDLAFTYGPLGHMLCPFNEGTAFTSSSVMLLALYTSWWISIGLLVRHLRGSPKSVLFVLGNITFGLVGQYCYSCASSVILLATAGFLVLAQVSGRFGWAIPAAFLTAVGLLSKFNIGVACAGSFLAYVALGPLYFGTRRAVIQGALLIGLLATSLIVLFMTVNGPLSSLDDYFQSNLWIASGYSSQMVVYNPYEYFLLMLTGLLAVGLLLPLRDRGTAATYIPLLFILALPLFLSYKSEFVRCDQGHLLTGIPTVLALVCLLLPARLGERGMALFEHLVPATMLAILLAMVLMFSQDTSAGLQSFPLDGPRHLAQLFTWDKSRLPFRKAFEVFCEKQALPPDFLTKIKDAPVDVYPWDISLIVANRLQWTPRYGLQSYQSYHPAIDERGAELYRGPHAPRFVLYRHLAIDGQQPCLVDSRTWMEIYRWYDLADVEQLEDLLLLERRNTPRFGEPLLLETRTVAVGQEIVLPSAGDGLLFFEVDFGLSPLGKIKEQLYKVQPPVLLIEYFDGKPKWHTSVWRNLSGGAAALVSNLPRDLDSAAAAFRGMVPDRVRSLTPIASSHWFNKELHVRFYIVKIADQKL